MAVNTSTLIKTMAQAAKLAAPYLTEGATEIDASQLVGKRPGNEYEFTVDYGSFYTSQSGMGTPSSKTASSATAKLKIWNAGSCVNPGTLGRKLEFGDWEQFAKDTGVGAVNEMVKMVAVADMGRCGSVEVATGVKDLLKYANRLNKFNKRIFAYGAYDGVSEVLGTSKLNCPVIMDDAYVSGDAYKVGHISTMRNIPVEASAITGFYADKLAVDMDGGTDSAGNTVPQVTVTSASATKIDIPAGTLLKVSGAAKAIFFTKAVTKAAGVSTETQTTTDVVLIGIDADLTTSSIDTSHAYAPFILRSEGAQGFVDASSCVEAADANEGEGGVGVAHTEIKQADRSIDHYFDVVGAYGICKKDATCCVLLQL